MARIKRQAEAVWNGDLPSGKGTFGTGSKVLWKEPYSFGTRFEQAPGTNPEELLAAAHASCFAMAFANSLAKKGYAPQEISVSAECLLEKTEAGFAITTMKLFVSGKVPGLTPEDFKAEAEEADKGCPVSNLLRQGLKIELESELK